MESGVLKIPEDIRQLQERLAVHGSVSIFLIPRSQPNSKGNAHSRKEHKTLEVSSPDISGDSMEGNALNHDVVSMKPNVGTGQGDSSKSHPEGTVKEVHVIQDSPCKHDKLMTTEASNGLHTPADNHDSTASASGSSSGCNHTSGTPNPPKQMDANGTQNALLNTQQSQSTEQNLTDNTNLGDKSSPEKQSKTETESTGYHCVSLPGQKYNLREVVQAPIRFTSYSSNMRSGFRTRLNNSNKRTCVKITLPSLDDASENRLITVFSEIGKLLACKVAVDKRTNYTTQQEPSEKSQGKPQQYTEWTRPQPQLPTLHASGHNLYRSCDKSDKRYPRADIPTTSVNMLKRREPMPPVTKGKSPCLSVSSDKNMPYNTRQTEGENSLHQSQLHCDDGALIPEVVMDC